MNESALSALYRQHHDVEAPRVDDRHFPAGGSSHGSTGCSPTTAAELHAAADCRELVDRVCCRAFTLSFDVRDRPGVRKFISELRRRRSRCVGQAPPDPRRARFLAVHLALSLSRARPILDSARAALSLRSENRPRLGNRRNQGAADDMIIVREGHRGAAVRIEPLAKACSSSTNSKAS
jgi:hypothetical protein